MTERNDSVDWEKERGFRRGDVWYLDDPGPMTPGITVGTRPCVIVSNDAGNRTSPVVTVLPMTASERGGKIPTVEVVVRGDGRVSRVQCNQIRTVSKDSLKNWVRALSADEMALVDAGIMEAIDIAPKAEPDELVELRLERDMYKMLYEASLKKFAGYRVSEEVQAIKKEFRKTETYTPDKPVAVKSEEAVESEADKLDLNSAGFDTMRAAGIPVNVCLGIIAGRPYKSVDGLDGSPGMKPETVEWLKPKFEVPLPRIRVNEMSVEEMVDCGVGITLARKIVIHRNRYGKFADAKNLMVVQGFGERNWQKFKDRIVV